MSEYVDRGHLDRELQELIKQHNRKCESDKSDGVFEALYHLRLSPTADVSPVVRGEWIDIPDGTETICSYCKAGWNVFDNDTYMFNYCPNCGAKMDLE